MLSDIEIAQKNEMLPVTDIASTLGLSVDDIDLYGKYKAKLTFPTLKKRRVKKDHQCLINNRKKRGLKINKKNDNFYLLLVFFVFFIYFHSLSSILK